MNHKISIDRTDLAERLARGETLSEAARAYGCSTSTVCERAVAFGLRRLRPIRLRLGTDATVDDVRAALEALRVSDERVRAALAAMSEGAS